MTDSCRARPFTYADLLSRKSLRESRHQRKLSSRAKGHTRRPCDLYAEQNSLSQCAENGRGSECRSFRRHGTRCREIETGTREEERRGESPQPVERKRKAQRGTGYSRNEISLTTRQSNLIGGRLQLLEITDLGTNVKHERRINDKFLRDK